MIYFTYTVRTILAVAFLLYLPSKTEAQVSISANDLVVQPEETFVVDVSARGFQNILTCQFSVSWNSVAFEFKGVENLNEVFEDYPLDHFGFAQVSSGKLGFSWIDFTLAGVAIDDNDILFSVRLKALQEESGIHQVGFTGDPTAIEVADTAENILDVAFQEGTIIIDGISNIRNKEKAGLVQINSSPNPFTEQAQVEIDFLRPASAHITIHDVQGATLYQESANFRSGPHRLILTKDIFPQAGAYILKVRAGDTIVTHKLIVI
ncbi:MAG: T9SS type A sorting domain-containing protein [Phaeodactylibacter sp.]|nr:T9SS type A sorting domain-containing protein [Phaeodactylibacter sp.]MCB9296368.1 T9SS type A sorting domain-containing protein [Lewinellaceae bacterium]